jgi:hypothetical protein
MGKRRARSEVDVEENLKLEFFVSLALNFFSKKIS